MCVCAAGWTKETFDNCANLSFLTIGESGELKAFAVQSAPLAQGGNEVLRFRWYLAQSGSQHCCGFYWAGK